MRRHLEDLIEMAGKQQLLDRFTSVDEILAKILDIQRKKYEKNYEIFFLTYPDDGTRATFAVGTTTLDFAAGTIEFPDGNVDSMSSSLRKQKRDFMRSFAINCNQAVVVQLDGDNKSPVRANVWGKMTYQQFTVARVTATVETIGYIHACTNPQAIHEQIGETTVAVGKETITFVSSDKDTHFTGVIAENAVETENLTLTDNKITIIGISLQSDQQLNYRVFLYGSDKFNDADLDVNKFIEFVNMDLTLYGGQIAGAGAWLLAQTGLAIGYEDMDATNELHVALQNLSSTSKNAGATGEVVLRISYIPRM